MAVRTEELQLRVLIDGSQPRRELAQLDQEYAHLKTQIKDLGANTKEAEAAMVKLGKVQAKREGLQQQLKDAEELKRKYQEIAEQMNQLSRDRNPGAGTKSPESIAYLKEMDALRAKAEPLRQEMIKSELQVGKWRKELSKAAADEAKLTAALQDAKTPTAEAAAALKRLAEIDLRRSELRKEIGLTALTAKQLGDELRRLTLANRNMNDSSPQWQENSRRIGEIKQRLKELNNETARAQAVWNEQAGSVNRSTMTMGQMRMEIVRLKAAMEHLDTSTPQFAALRKELARTEAQLAGATSGLGRLGRAWQGIKGQMAGTIAGVGMLFTGGAIMGAVKNWVSGAATMSDALADVRRTTGLTEAGVTSLNKSLRTVDTRTPRTELLALAAVAGKVGINAEKDVLGFVRAADQIKVALGEDLGEGAIRQVAKLVQTFKVGETHGYDLERSMLSAGSAVNELGNSSTAAEAYLVDYASRLAGVNVQAKVSIENTLGYAAAADQLNLKVETTATAMSQFTVKAFKNTAEYAKIAGMELKEFTSLLKADTNEALLRVLEGLNGNNAGLDVMVSKFGDLGQEGARAVSVLASLSGQTKLIREQQVIANRAMQEGTSITKEFSVRNENFAANLEKIGKGLRGMFINSSVVQGFKDLTASVVGWMRVPVSKKLEEERFELQMTYAKILQYNEGSNERTKLIKELQQQYPGFLANIDAEKVSNGQLTESIRQLNSEMVNKIILQKQDEKIQDQQKRQADYQMAVMEREDKLRKSMVALAEKEGVQLKSGVPLMEQAIDLSNQLHEARKKTFKTGGGVFDPLANMGQDIDQLRQAQGLLNSELNVSNRLAKEREDLMQRLGISTTPAAAPSPAAMPDVADPDAPEAIATDDGASKRDAALKAMEALRADMQKLQRDMELDALSADERAIAQLDDKFAEIRRKTLENAYHTNEDLVALENTYEDARAELLSAQAAERERKAVEARQNALEAVDQAEEEYWQSKLGAEDQEIVVQMQRMEALVELYEQAGLDTQGVVERTEAAITAIRQKYREQEERDAIDALKKRIQEQVHVYQAVGSAIGGVNDFLAATYSAQENNNYQNTVAAKSLGLAQIAISSGVGVANAISSGAGMPFPANIAAIATGVGAVLSGIAQAVGLLRAANVSKPSGPNASPTQPSLENVPLGEKGGIFQGKSHAQGGLAVVDRESGRVEAEVEGGEPWMVLSNNFRRNNPGLIPRLLHASATGERLAASGGIFAPAPAFNFARATESMRIMQFAQGGLLNAAAVETKIDPDGMSAEILRTLQVIAAGIDRVDDGVRTAPTVLKAEVSLQDLQRRQAELSQLQDLNRVGR